MPNLLKNLELEELSLVDRPANAQAMVSLFKRDTSEEEHMKNEDMKVEAEEVVASEGEASLEKAAPEAETEHNELDLLKQENERLRKSLIENGYVIKADVIEKKAEVEMIEVEGEMVAKSDIPAPVLKALEVAKAEAEAAAIEKADIELTKRAEEALPHFDVAVAKSLVKAFSEEEAIMEALKAADKAFEAAMAEFGKSDVDGEFDSASDKLDALVKSYMDQNEMKKGEYAKAYAMVAKTDEGKALIAKSYKGE